MWRSSLTTISRCNANAPMKTNSRINIAYVIDTISTARAGTEKQLLMLIKNIDRNKFVPHLIVLRNSKWLEDNELQTPVYNVKLASFRSLNLFNAFHKFRRYCQKNNITIVQTFFRDANIFGSIAACLSGVKLIISSRRNYGLGYWHNRYRLMVLQKLKYITTCYIANSKVVAYYTANSEKVDIKKIHVIYNGINHQRQVPANTSERDILRINLGIQSSQILIGAIANLRAVKNLSLFIRTAARTHKEYPQTRYIIVGEGPERARLEAMIKQYSLNGIVMLLGQQSDVVPFLLAMDIAVLCSKAESLSNAIVEYLTFGLPCVVSDVGGNREAIGYEHGLTFQSDDEDDFFSKLAILIEDREMRIDMGRRGQKYAWANYNCREMVNSYESIYSELMSRRAG